MRDIYTHGIITTDFVLVMGDLVSNVRIDEVVRIHKERRKTNKNAIMTMVVKESGAVHRTRCVSSPFRTSILHPCSQARCNPGQGQTTAFLFSTRKRRNASTMKRP